MFFFLLLLLVIQLHRSRKSLHLWCFSRMRGQFNSNAFKQILRAIRQFVGRRHPSHQTLNDYRAPALKEGPAASHWHMPGKSSWRRMVCHWDQLSGETGEGWGECGKKKPPGWLQQSFEKPLSHVPFKPTCWLEVCSLTTLGPSCPSRLWVVPATWGCSPWGAGMLGGWNAGRVHGGTALGQTD